eukprot:6365860-Prorocentrum_lima.AAC.1
MRKEEKGTRGRDRREGKRREGKGRWVASGSDGHGGETVIGSGSSPKAKGREGGGIDVGTARRGKGRLGASALSVTYTAREGR